MWTKFADWVLRYRIWVIAFVLVITGVLSFFAKDIELSYDFKKLIPASDPDNVYYENFKKNFGEDGSVMVIGISADNLFEEKLFTNWCKLTDDISAIDGVKRVLSFKTMVNIVKEPYPYYESYPISWQNAPCHTIQGGAFIFINS